MGSERKENARWAFLESRQTVGRELGARSMEHGARSTEHGNSEGVTL